jgi:hypothetical protein
MSGHAFAAAALLLALLPGVPAHAQQLDRALVGEWSGTARITVDWTTRRELPVRVTIRDDGTADGTIGDAQLRNGHIRTNRSVVARAMGLGTDYVIEGKLAGSIIQAEAIERATVRLPLNWTGSTLEGELATSGSLQARRGDMVLTASGLVLRRVGVAPTSSLR